MIKNLRFYLVALSLLLINFFTANAQNCTVNAGINKTICPGSPFILTGAGSGLFNNTAVWSQVSGPSVNISATTISSGKADATVTGFTTNVNYVFRLSGKCIDGSLVYQDVIYIVSDLGYVNAGLDNYGCPGTPFILQGSALGASETGEWTIIAGGTGPTITSSNTPNAIVTFPTESTAKVYTFRWTVSKTTGASTCSSFDDVIITNLGTSAINAGTDINLSCYNVTTSTILNGSNAGANATYSQSVLWTVVSGPSVPTFDSNTKSDPKVSSLIQGTYVFRYTVNGPCKSGSDEVSVIVGPASQNNTNAGSGTQTYCDNRTTAVLSAPKALYNGETMTWTGPGGGVVVNSPNSNVTTVTGLSGINGTSTTFTYTIKNTLTFCTSTGTYNIVFRAAPTISITGTNPIFATCGVSTAVVNYIESNGTGTQYALISAPAGSIRQSTMGGLNNYITAPVSGTTLTGFDKIGTYVISYRRNTDNGNGGCQDAYADVSIVVSAVPTASNAGTPQVLACNVVGTALAGNQPVTGIAKWSQVSGPNAAVITNPFDNNSPVSGLIAGLYTFRWIISGGDGACVNAQSDVTVKVSTTTPTASVVGSSVVVCNSTPVYLTGNTPALNETGAWTVTKSPGLTAAPEVVFSSSSNPTAVASSLADNTAYTFTWTITNNCSADFPGSVVPASYTITTSNIAGPKLAESGADFCLAGGTTIIQLNGNAPTGGETGSWIKISGPAVTITNSTLYNTTVTGAVNGTYVFEWKLEKNACSPTTDQIKITISAAASTAIAGSTQNICGTSVKLAGNVPAIGIGLWTQTAGAGGITITDTADPETTVTGLTSGRYKFTWTINNGTCASSAPSEVTVNVSNPSSTAIAGGDQSICNATNTLLAAAAVTGGTGNWSAVSGPSVPTFADSTNPTTTISNLKYGKYILRWTSRGGIYCPISTDDVEIIVTQNANAGTDRALCGATSVTLTGNENSAGTWIADAANPTGSTLTAVGTNGAIVTGLLPGLYKFKYTLPIIGTCPSTEDEVQINIEASPSAAVAGADQAKCQLTAETSTVFLMDADVVTVGTGKWVLLDSSLGIPNANNPIITDIADPKTNITVTTPGVFLYEWRVENVGGACAGGSANADIVRITAFKEPSAAIAGPNQLNACSDKVTMAATTPLIGIGTWSVLVSAGGTPVFEEINSPTTKITGLVTGSYTFTWTVSNGSPLCASKFANVNVNVTTAPVTVANAGTDQKVCNTLLPGKTSFMLAGNAVTALETGTWTIISQPAGSAATFNSANSNTATISGLQAATSLAVGEYILRWTVKNTVGTATDCESYDEVKILVYNTPSVSVAGPNQNVCNTSTVTLAATAIAVDRGLGKWSNKVGNTSIAVFSDEKSPSSGLSGLLSGSYTLIWTVSNGNCVVSTSEVTITVSNCEIAVAKSTSTPVQQADGSYNITLTFKVKNTGNAPLTGVQVEDNLKLTFPSPKTWTVSSLSATGTLVANATTGTGSFTGNTGNANQQLLTNASSLAAGVEEIITLALNVKFN